MCHKVNWMFLAAMVVLTAGMAQAINIDLVPVGNAGNAGELSGSGDLARICGAVGYTYNIGKYEVTAGQYTAFLNAVGGVDTYFLYNSNMSNTSNGSGIVQSGGGTVGNPYTYSVAADFANRPVNYVFWGDAARFANWLHNNQPTASQGPSTTEDGAYNLNGATTNADLLAISREADWKWTITNEDEWYKAAYYKGGGTSAGYWDYPTGVDTPATPGRDMDDVSGNNANYHQGLETPYPIDSGDSGKYTTIMGEFQNSDSPYGTFDQGGNVWEWNESFLYGSSRGLRGGSFAYDSNGLLASSRGNGIYPDDESSYVGFRVASVPEPGSLAMLAGIALTALLYHWRKHA